MSNLTTPEVRSRTKITNSEISASPIRRANSSRLLFFLIIDLVLIVGASSLRSSRALREYLLRGKDTPELEALVQRQPDDGLARYYLAKSYYLNHRFSDARSHYEEAARLD